MEVTGITAAKAQEIENASITSGYIAEGTGHLILKTKAGTEIDAGLVVADALAAWPVGSIFMNVTATNPSTLLGGGTWTRWGQGRVPVSLDSTQTEFDTAEETGGEKTVTLTEAQMPSHSHNGTAESAGAHAHSYYEDGGDGFISAAAGTLRAQESEFAERNTGTAGAHTHAVTTEPEGGSQAHNNLQPYITVYMWKRTA